MEDTHSFVESLSLRIRASFSAKRPAKDAAKADPYATAATPASPAAHEDPLARARREALEASKAFDDAMKEDESAKAGGESEPGTPATPLSPGGNQNQDSSMEAVGRRNTLVIDPDFMNELQKRRKEREALEAKHAEQLRQAFLQQKQIDDEIRAKEQAEYAAKKRAEEDELLRSKVRLTVSPSSIS